MLLLAACGGGPPMQDDGSGDDQVDGGSPETTGSGTAMDRRGNDARDLAGTRWVLTGLNGGGLVEGTRITLAFQRDALRGNAGCNSYGSRKVRAANGFFEVGPVEMTMVGCKGAVGRQESAYLEALQAPGTYRLREDRLEIRDDSGETTLLFRKETG